MKPILPEFHLSRILDDGTVEEPQVVSAASMPWDKAMSRRSALGTGVALSGVAAFLASKNAVALAHSNQAGDFNCVAPTAKLTAHRGSIVEIRATADAKILATGGTDNLVKLWSVPEGKLLATLDGHMGPITSLAFTTGGKLLASGSEDRTVRLWSIPDGKLESILEGHTARISALGVSTDGKFLASASGDHSILLWSLPQGIQTGVLEGHSNAVRALVITPDSSLLASAGDDNSVRLWSVPEQKCVATMEGHKDTVWALALNPSGNLLCSGSQDKTIKIWILPEGGLSATLSGHNAAVRELAFSPDGAILASAGEDKTVKLWSLPDAKPIATLEGHSGPIWALAFSPNGHLLSSASEDRTVRLWSVPGYQLIATLEGHKAEVNALAMVPQSAFLVSGSADFTAVVWDLRLATKTDCFRSYLFDPKSAASDVKGVTYNKYDRVTGETATYTLPCGSPIPPGAVCTCNCVPGTYLPTPPPPKPRPEGGGYIPSLPPGGHTYCQCDKVCTCVPISSRRWKQNIRPLGRAVEKVLQLRAVRFDRISNMSHNRLRPSEIGLIAEEAAEVIPELVASNGEAEHKNLDYGKLTVLLIETIKAQQSQITALASDLQRLNDGCAAVGGEEPDVPDLTS
jgi:WD40 repeat protein